MPDALPLDRVHLVGIGGAGMSGIARILLSRGARVSGSDAQDSVALGALRVLGADIFVGHAAANLRGEPVVVVSSAIRPTNPEVQSARERGLAVLPRAAALAALMAGRRGVAVAGTHGKTTTTSMLVVALQHCGADPSFAIGADLNETGSGAHEGSGDLFVVEADESDGSFLLLAPQAAVVTNIEADHLDHYGDEAAVVAAFDSFAARIAPEGFLVACADDPGARRLAERAAVGGLQVLTYGQSIDADLQLRDVQVRPDGTAFGVSSAGRSMGAVRLRVVGLHNALDAGAALLAGLRLGQPFDGLAAGLRNFAGARRRFEAKGVARGVRVYDDYAHNPAKVAAALAGARVVAGEGRLLVVFQPHLFSRTKDFAGDFGAALGQADEVVVLDVYGAREDPVPGVSGALIASAVPLPGGRVHYQPYMAAAAEQVAVLARPGDLVMTVGAGDVTLVGPEVLALLRETGRADAADRIGGDLPR